MELPEKRTRRKSDGNTRTAGKEIGRIIFEEIVSEGKQVFARSDQLGLYSSEIKIESETYVPIPKDAVAWQLAGPPVPYGAIQELFESVKLFISTFLEFSNPNYYDVAAAFVLMTWRFTSFTSVPFLWIVAPYFSGKSTFLKILNQLCYRATMFGVGSLAGMSRLVHAFGCTLLVDEAQVNEDPHERSEFQAWFNDSYQSEGRRLISSGGGEGSDWIPKFFNSYSPKVMASTNIPWNAIATRCLIFKATKTERKDLPQVGSFSFKKQALELRSKLLQYRFDHLLDPVPEHIPDLDSFIDEPRLREIALPLLTVAAESAHQAILEYLRDLEGERQAEEETSDEAAYVQAIVSLKEKGKVGQHGYIPIQDIRDALRIPLEVTEDRYLPSPRKVTQNLKALGFKTTKHAGESRTLRGIIYDEKIVNRLADRYIRSHVLPSENLGEHSNGTIVVEYPVMRKELCRDCYQKKYRNLIGVEIARNGVLVTGRCEDCGESSSLIVLIPR